MTELDQALEKYREDDEHQDAYYDLVLNTDFYIPTCEPEDENPDSVVPLLFESEGKSYLMLFDSEERLTAWAKQPVRHAVLAGHLLAEIATPEIHWAVNFGDDNAKEFVPEEIKWLKDGTNES